MKIRLPLLAATLLLGSVAAPAFADCMSDMKPLEPKVAAVSNTAKKERAQKSISLALEHAQKGDEKGCEKLLSSAKAEAGLKGGKMAEPMKTSDKKPPMKKKMDDEKGDMKKADADKMADPK